MHGFYKFSFAENKSKALEERAFNHELKTVSEIAEKHGIGEHYIFPDECPEKGMHSFSVYGYKASHDVSQSERNFDVLHHSGVLSLGQLSLILGAHSVQALGEQLLSGQITGEKAKLLQELYQSYCMGAVDKMNVKEIKALIEKDLIRLKLNK